MGCMVVLYIFFYFLFFCTKGRDSPWFPQKFHTTGKEHCRGKILLEFLGVGLKGVAIKIIQNYEMPRTLLTNRYTYYLQPEKEPLVPLKVAWEDVT